jgi:hypothetical protein
MEWVVFPNPTENELNITINFELKSALNVSVYDVSGRHVFNRNIGVAQPNENMTFDVSSLNQGLYKVVIQTEEFVDTKSLVISK